MRSCPDFEYIRSKVSIADVARELGLQVLGYRARCWRHENHKNGDASPSVAFQKAKNKGRCFVCDPQTWSNIDLVMLVNDCDLAAAIAWITARFPVPNLPKGTHIKKREAWSPRFHCGVAENVITVLVRGGLWSDLSHAERSILPVLVTFANRDTLFVDISYQGIMRHSGVGSTATVAKALRHFRQMGFLRVMQTAGRAPLRNVNRYQLDLDDPKFHSLVMNVFQRQREEIEVERELRKEARQCRTKSKPPVQVILSSLAEERSHSPLQLN